MIEQTKQEVEQHYCTSNGYEADAKVIYGDTDSVMVNFKVKTLEKSMELGREAAELISKKFIEPIKLEFEKVSFFYCILRGCSILERTSISIQNFCNRIYNRKQVFDCFHYFSKCTSFNS